MASLKECEWCELCSLFSTITSLHSCEHAGQSEINVLSLGNTQELVSFIVLSSVDNCFAAVPQNDKTMSLWQMARSHVQECLTTGCNIVSHLFFFSSASSQPLCLNFLSKYRRLSMKPGKTLSFFLALTDGGFEGLILMFCCRVRCNPHQSAAKETKTKTKKSRCFTLPPSSA